MYITYIYIYIFIHTLLKDRKRKIETSSIILDRQKHEEDKLIQKHHTQNIVEVIIN